MKSTVESSDASQLKSRSESTPTSKAPENNGTESTGKPRGASLNNNSGDKKGSAKKQGKLNDSAKKDAKEPPSKADNEKTPSGDKAKATSEGQVAPEPVGEKEKSSTDVPAEQVPPETTGAADTTADVHSSPAKDDSTVCSAEATCDELKQTEPTMGTQVQDENRKPGDGERPDRQNYRGGYRNRGGDYHKRGGRRGFPGGGLKSPPYRANFEISKTASDDVPAEGESKVLEGEESGNTNVVTRHEGSESTGAPSAGQEQGAEGEVRERKNRGGRRGRGNRFDRPGYYAPRQYPARQSRSAEQEDQVQGEEEKKEKSAGASESTKETSELSAGEEKGADASGRKKKRKPRKPRSRSKSVGSIEGEQVNVDQANGYTSQDETSNQRERDNSPGRRRQYTNTRGNFRGGRGGGYYRNNYNQGNYYRPRNNFNPDQGGPPGGPALGQERIPGQYYNNSRGGYNQRPYNQQRSYYNNYNRGTGGPGYRPAGLSTGGPQQPQMFDRSNQVGGNFRGTSYRRGEGGRPGYSHNRRYQNMQPGYPVVDLPHEREVVSGDT